MRKQGREILAEVHEKRRQLEEEKKKGTLGALFRGKSKADANLSSQGTKHLDVRSSTGKLSKKGSTAAKGDSDKDSDKSESWRTDSMKKEQKGLKDALSSVINKKGIDSEEELDDMLALFMSNVALTFNTNVLRIALNQHEEKVACLLAAFYTIRIDEEMMLRAVKTG